MMEVTIPGLPPEANHYVRHSRGRHYKTQEALRFEETVWALCHNMTVTGQSLKLTCHFYFKNRRRADIDNRVKLLADSLVLAQVIPDDSLIDEIVLKRFYADEEKTVVRLEAR